MSSIALCIPAYNAALYLPRLLMSATNQRIAFNEILVYNDCSTDNSSRIASQFGALVVEGDINRGCSIGKNKLAEIAKSEWLHFHDADDDILPDFTETIHKWIINKKSPDIVLLHYNWINFKTKKLLGQPDYKIEQIAEDTVKFNITNKVVNFALIKKKSFLNIGGFDTDKNVLFNEDRAFYTKAAIKGLSFDYEPTLTCINYYYPGSMSEANKAKCAKASLVVWQKVIKATKQQYSKEIAQQILNNATFAATANDWQTVRGSIKIVKEIYQDIKPQGSRLFLKLYQVFPYAAFVIREYVLRYFFRKR